LSFSWRERLKRSKKRILDGLDIQESEKEKTWAFIWENIGSFCKESDDQVKVVFGDRCNIDEEVEKLFQDEFDEMAKDIVEKILERLGYDIKRKSKKKSKKKRIAQDGQTGKEVETEESVETDSDSDADSDADSEAVQEQEAEVVAH